MAGDAPLAEIDFPCRAIPFLHVTAGTAIVRLSYRNFVRLPACHTGVSVKNCAS